MIKEIFVCGECGLAYYRKDLAMRCELWCREHRSNNLGIVKDAVGRYQELDFQAVEITVRNLSANKREMILKEIAIQRR